MVRNRKKQNQQRNNENLTQMQNMEKKLAVISSNTPKVEMKWSSRNIDFNYLT